MSAPKRWPTWARCPGSPGSGRGAARCRPQPEGRRAGAAVLLRTHRDAADRRASQRAATVLRPALSRSYQHPGRAGPRSTIRSATGCGSRPPVFVLQTVAIPRGQIAIAAGHAERLRHQARPEGGAGADRIWHLLDHVPGARLSDRLLPHRSGVPRRWFLELRFRHDAAGARPGRTFPASRPEHLDEDRGR